MNGAVVYARIENAEFSNNLTLYYAILSCYCFGVQRLEKVFHLFQCMHYVV